MRRKTAVRRAVAGLAAVAGIGLLLPSNPASADGTETLGPPSIDIAEGSGVVTEGTGLFVQPSAVTVNVPAHAAVKQAIVYWQGEHRGAPDNTIVVNGTEVSGTQIGGPTVFYADVKSTSYRADVTSRGLIKPGANNVTFSGLNFDVGNNGASIVVIYDDGSGIKEVGVRDGNDNAFAGFPGALQVTVPQTFPVTPAAQDREAQIDLIVGSVDSNRGSLVRITSGGNVFQSTNLLGDTDDKEWDDVTVPFVIPAGATNVTVEIISQDVDGKFAASLTWVAAVLSQPNLCPPSNVPAKTKGSAFAVDAKVLGLVKLHAQDVKSAAPAEPGVPTSEAKPGISVSLPGLVSANVLATSSNSKLNPSTTTSSATVADVSLLSGLVRASTVKSVSQSTASTHGASFNSNGSTIVGLTVGGAGVNVAPNVKVAVKLLGITIAELHVMEEQGASSYADGASKASHSINALRLVLLKSFLGYPAGTQVIVSHADSSAQSPIACPDEKTVSGEAFTAYVDGNLGGKDLVDVMVGDAVLPSVGGSDSDGAIVNVPGVAFSATAANTTKGSLSPNPNAASRSLVQGVNILNGLVTAQVLDVKASSTANGTTAGTHLEATFVDLRVNGKLIVANGTVGANGQIIVDLGHLGYVEVLLNEQTKNTQGGKDTEGTVNAVHVRAYSLGGRLTGEVIVASAHSDAHA